MQQDSDSLDQAYEGSRYDSSLESSSPQLTPVPGLPSANRLADSRRNKPMFIVSLVAVALISALGVATLLFSSAHPNDQSAQSQAPQAANYAVKSLPLQGVKDNTQLEVGEANRLSINGQLSVNGTFVIKPTTAPVNPVAGQVYYDKATNQPYFYNGSQFIGLSPTPVPQHVDSLGGLSGVVGLGDSLQVTGSQLGVASSLLQSVANASLNSARVSSLQGLTGAVTINAGGGIGINGTTISNDGVVSLASGSGGLAVTSDGNGNYAVSLVGGGAGVTSIGGTSGALSLGPGLTVSGTTLSNSGVIGLVGTVNQLAVSAATGTVTLSLPQDIATTSNPNFGGLTLGSAGSITGNLNLANGASGRLVDLQGLNPSGSGNATIQIPSIAGGSIDTVCLLSLANCSGAGGGVTGSGTANTLPKFTASQVIGDSGISDDGTNVTIAGGEGLVAGTVSASTLQSAGTLAITPGGNLTIGATNHQFLLQGNGSSTFAASSGGNTTTVGFLAPTGARAINFPNESGTICLQSSVNCGFATSGSGVTSLDNLTGILTVANSSGVGTTVTINDAAADGATKGIATFNSTNFTAAAGVINTIQGISTAANVQFASLTLGTGGDLNLSPTGTLFADTVKATPSGSGNLSLYSGGGGSNISFSTDGGSNSFMFPTTGGTGQVICTSGISCASGGGQAVILEPGVGSGSAQTASANRPAIWVNKSAGTGNLIELQDGGSDAFAVDNSGNTTINAGSVTNGFTIGGALGVNTITPSGTLTVGATGQAFTLQGNGGSVIAATGGGALTKVGFAIGSGGTAPNGNVTYQFLNDNTVAAGTYTVCTTSGNCAGVGGSITGSGTAGNLAKFTGTGAIGNSILTDNGTTVTIAGNLAVGTSGASQLSLGVGSSASGTLVFKNSSNNNNVTFQLAAAPGSNIAISVPNQSGTLAVAASGPLSLDATTGQLSCATCLTSGGGGGASGVVSLDNLTGILTVANSSGVGTTVTINDAAADGATKGIATFNSTNFTAAAGVINTIQNIATGSSPTFTNLALQGATGLTVGSSSNLGKIAFKDGTADGFTSTFSPATLTGSQTIAIPNASGTLAVSASGNLSLSALGALTFSNSPTFTGTLTVQGSGGLTIGIPGPAGTTGNLNLANATSSRLVVLQGLNPSGAGNATVQIPTIAGGNTDTICLLTLANCVGAGGAVSTTGGTQNYITKYNNAGATQLTSSELYDSGTGVAIGNASPAGLFNVGTTNQFQVSGAGAVTALGVNSGAGLLQGSLGLTITGAAVSLNNSSNFNTSINTGTSTGSVHIADGTGTGTIGIGNANSGAIALQSGSSIGLTVGATSESLTTAGDTIKTTTNSATAFQIQNTSSAALFQVDTLNNNIVLGGNNSGELQPWQLEGTNSLPNARDGATSVTANGYLYEFGGSSTSAAGGGTTSVYYSKLNASGSIGTWQTGVVLPAARYFATSVVYNGYVYVMGGQNTSGTAQSTVYYAKLNVDGSVGSWQTAVNSPAARYFATSVVYNGYVYIFGGDNTGGTAQNTALYAKLNADGSTGVWNSTSTMPGTQIVAASVAANGYVYVIGGAPGFSTVYYSLACTANNSGSGGCTGTPGTVGTWQSAAHTLPLSGREYLTAAVANGYVYAFGGLNGSAKSDVFYATLNSDGSVGSWQTAGNALTAARYRATTVVANGYIYEIGGLDSSATAQTTIYYASTQRVKIGGSLDLVGLDGSNLGDPGDPGSGSPGGSLTAGDTNIVGLLQVQGQANFAQGVGVGGAVSITDTLAVNGSGDGSVSIGALFKNATDSTTAFEIQNATGNQIFSVDTSGGQAVLGKASTLTGKILFDGSGGAGTLALAGPTTPNAGNFTLTIPAITANANVCTDNSICVGYQPVAASGSYIQQVPTTTAQNTVTPATNSVVGLTVNATTGTAATAAILNQTQAADGLQLNVTNTTGTQTNGILVNRNGTGGTTTNGLSITNALGTTTNGLQLTQSGGTFTNGINFTGTFTSLINSTNFSVANSGNLTNSGTYNTNAFTGSALTFGTAGTATIQSAAGQALNIGSSGNTSNSLSLAAGTGAGAISIGTTASVNKVVIGSTTAGSTLTLQAGATSESVTGTGDLIKTTGTGSTTAFQIQNASGASLLNVDSTNSNISILTNNTGETQVWQTNANNLTAVRRKHSTVSANGYLYVIGGVDGSGTAQTTVMDAKISANGSTGTWSNTSSLPAARSVGAAVTANGYVYYLGGSNTDTVMYAKLNNDGSTGTWNCQGTSGSCGTTPTNANSITAGASGLSFQSAFASNGYIYVVGSNGSTNATTYYAKVYADGTTGVWNTTASLSVVRNLSGLSVANGYVYLAGGEDGGGAAMQTTFFAKINLDGTLSAWQCQGTNSTVCGISPFNNVILPAATSATSMVAANGYLYLVGGESGAAVSNVYYTKLNSDGSIAGWTLSGNTLPSTLFWEGTALVNGYIYATGGSSGSVASPTVLQTVYYASLSRISAAGSLDLVGTSGQNLLDAGNQAGSLTAGNTSVLGALNVNDQASFLQGVSIGKDLEVGGSVLVQNVANSTNAFQIQNSAAQNLFQVDTTNSNITIDGNNSPALAGWNSTTVVPANTQGAQVTANGYVYILGGDGDAATTTVRYARLNANGTIPAGGQPGTWSTTTAMPQAVEFAQAVSLNGYVYVLGGGLVSGRTSNVYFAKENLDGTLGSWTQTTSFPTLANGLSSGSAATYNGYIYEFGGYTNNPGLTTTNNVYYAKANGDGTIGAWNTTTVLPVNMEGNAVAVANGYVYIVGGYNGSFLNSVYYAKLNVDGTVGTWQTNGTTPTTAGEGAAATVLNGYLYVVGGATGIGTHSAAVNYAPLNANGSVGAWSAGPSLPTAEGPNNIFNVNGYVYVIGGEASSGIATALYTTSPRVQIGGSLDLVGLGGQNLADGGSGGTLTAGNTTIVGTLQVQDQTTLARGLSVGNTLAVAGQGVFKNTANSTSAFQVQNASGSDIFTVDTTNGKVGTVNQTAASTASNALTIKSGDASGSSSNSGAVTIDSGTATGTAGNINIGTGAYAHNATIGNATGNSAVTLQAGTGGILLKPITGNATALTIQDSGGNDYLVADTLNVRLYVGNPSGDTTGTLLVLDNKSTSGDPTGVSGAMYYNASYGAFRCFNSNSIWVNCDTPSLRNSWFFYEDWLGGNVGSSSDVGDQGWAFSSIASGAVTKINPASSSENQGRIGIIGFQSTASSNSGISLHLTDAGGTETLAGTPGDMEAEFDFASTTDNIQQNIRIGLHDSTTTAAPNNGMWFEYDVTTSSGNWQRCTANNGTRTCTDTGIAKAAVNTYQKFRIETNDAGTQVNFYIDDASAGSNTTNLPTATHSYAPALNAYTKTSSQRIWEEDYYQLRRFGVSR